MGVGALAFGFAHLDQPAVLQKSEGDQQPGERGGDRQRRVAAQRRSGRGQPGHGKEYKESQGGPTGAGGPIYIPYQFLPPVEDRPPSLSLGSSLA